jgi:hypothetical protein
MAVLPDEDQPARIGYRDNGDTGFVVNPALPAFPAIGKADLPFINIKDPAAIH